jgi:iron complex outermembrane receptor protein
MGNALVSGDPYGSRIFSGLSGTVVSAYQVNDFLRASLTFSTAWRSPQVNELFSNGLHHGAARIEKGDPAIAPERAFNTLANLVYNKEKWEIDAGVYLKEISDFIYLKPVYPALLTIRGAFPAFAYAQTNASLTGTDISVGYAISSHLKSRLKTSFLRAYNKTEKTWLIQMPADRYEMEIDYLFVDGKRLKNQSVRLAFQYVTEQTRVPPTGNIKVKDASGNDRMQSDYMMPPPAYNLIHLEYFTSVQFPSTRIEFVLGVNNLLNTSYRDYMNAFRYFALDRGRNISFKVKIPF